MKNQRRNRLDQKKISAQKARPLSVKDKHIVRVRFKVLDF